MCVCVFFACPKQKKKKKGDRKKCTGKRRPVDLYALSDWVGMSIGRLCASTDNAALPRGPLAFGSPSAVVDVDLMSKRVFRGQRIIFRRIAKSFFRAQTFAKKVCVYIFDVSGFALYLFYLVFACFLCFCGEDAILKLHPFQSVVLLLVPTGGVCLLPSACFPALLIDRRRSYIYISFFCGKECCHNHCPPATAVF